VLRYFVAVLMLGEWVRASGGCTAAIVCSWGPSVGPAGWHESR
jgi:hypothetical protein